MINPIFRFLGFDGITGWCMVSNEALMWITGG